MIALSLALAQTPTPQNRIVAASLFKNGYAFVTREVQVPASGEVRVPVRLTLPAQGTFWYVPSQGLTIVSASFEHPEGRQREVKSAIPATLPRQPGELLAMSKGHTVHIELKFDRETQKLGDAREKVSGKLTAAGDAYVVLTEGTTNRIVPVERIYGFAIDDLAEADDPSVADLQGTLVFKSKGGTGAIRYVSLERGLTWLPSYRIDLLPNDSYRLIGQAIVYNELESISKANLHFVSGYPNLGNLTIVDPLFRKNLSEFLGLSQGGAFGGSGFGGGGRGGPGGAQGMNQLGPGANGLAFYAQDADTRIYQEFGSGRAVEGLYFYELAEFDARLRSTTSAMLFTTEGKFDRRYVSAAGIGANQDPLDVFQVLKFKNTGNKPLTTGAGAIFSGDDLVSQASLNVVPVGGSFDIQTSKAFDIRSKAESEIVGRDKDVVKDDAKRIFDAVTIKTTYTIENTKDSEVDFEFTTYFNGELRGADMNPKVSKMTTGDSNNPTNVSLKWALKLKPKSVTRFSATGRRIEFVRPREK